VSEPYSIVRIPEIEPISVAGVQWKPLRRTLGIDAFGINAYSANAVGDHVVEEHTEETLGHQEAYVVIVGHATFSLDGDEIDAPQGTVVFIRDPKVRRFATAVEPGTTVLAIGGLPGQHTPSAWEWYFEAEKYRESGDHAAALELLDDAQERFPDHAGVLYSLACWQSLAGDTDAAIESLNAAIAVKPEVAGWAKDDADLDAIRGLEGSPL
jgi:tetratricopeptide (TPR) repeat protein